MSITIGDLATRIIASFYRPNRRPITATAIDRDMKLEVLVARYWASVSKRNRKSLS